MAVPMLTFLKYLPDLRTALFLCLMKPFCGPYLVFQPKLVRLLSAYSENIFTGVAQLFKGWAAQFNFSDDSCGESGTDLREPAARMRGWQVRHCPGIGLERWIQPVTSLFRSCGKGKKCGSQSHSKHFWGRGRGFSNGLVWNLAVQTEKEGLRLMDCEDAHGVFYCLCCCNCVCFGNNTFFFFFTNSK